MKRLLIDSSHVLKMMMHASVNKDSVKLVEFNGKSVKVGCHKEAFQIALGSLEKTLSALNMTPSQIVLIKDGKGCKQFRRQFLPEYSKRPEGAPEFYQEYTALVEKFETTLLKYGALSVEKDGVEADDIIAYLAKVLDCVIWSGDSDMVAHGDVFFDGEMNKDRFYGIKKEHIVVYKSLVGDSSDSVPGCRDFGEGAFIKMLSKYSDSCLDDIKGMLEEECLEELEPHAKDFKPFQKILDNKEQVHNSYKCAKAYHPGYHNLKFKMLYPSGTGELPQWEPKSELITKDKLTPDFLKKLGIELRKALVTGLDIETYITEEGKAWALANKSKTAKKPPIDIMGAILAGFSLCTGSNNHKNYYFSVAHKDTDNITLQQAEEILNLLPEDVPVIVHNTSYELPVLRNHFTLKFDRGYLPPLTYDTRILAGYCDEYESASLKHWSEILMGYKQVTFGEVTEKPAFEFSDDNDDDVIEFEEESANVQMNELTGEEVLNYGCDDSICSVALFRYAEVLTKYEGSWNAYEKSDLASQFLYAESFLTGVKFDLDKCKMLQVENQKIYDETIDCIELALEGMEWSTTEEIPREIPRITPENINQIKELAKLPPEYITHHHYWPGAKFVPATELTPAEIKRLFLIYAGRELKTQVRKIEKIVEKIREEGEVEFADAVESGLASMNTLAEYSFNPKAEINLKSPKQKCELLYDALGYPIRIRGKISDKMRAEGRTEGNPSANDDAFKHAIAYDARDNFEKDLLLHVVKATSCRTEDSLFYAPYQNMPHYTDGYVHPNGGQALTKSGRPASNKPNFSQVSKISRVREVYVPLEEDHIWVSMDFTGQELVHTAVQSGDEAMLSCFIGDVRKDIHSMTGVEVFNYGIKAQYGTDSDQLIDYDTFMAIRKDEDHPLYKKIKDARTKAKPVNFLDLYLGTAITLAVDLMITKEEAQALLDAKTLIFPGVRKWQDDMTALHEERGYAVEPMGRRRHLRLDGTWKDKHELRGAINHIIQGGAATQTKIAMAKIWQQRVLETFRAYFLFPVYDEMNFSCHRDDVIPFLKVAHPIMIANYAGFPLEFESVIKIGRSFGELKEIGNTIDEEKISQVLAQL